MALQKPRSRTHVSRPRGRGAVGLSSVSRREGRGGREVVEDRHPGRLREAAQGGTHAPADGRDRETVLRRRVIESVKLLNYRKICDLRTRECMIPKSYRLFR